MAATKVVIASLLCFLSPCFCMGIVHNECQNKCELSYPLHTYPHAEFLTACKRGCRLNTISQLTEPEHEPKAAEFTCEKACKEAYDDDDDSEYACSFGCKNQKSIPSPAQILQNRDDDEDDFFPLTLHPVIILGSFCRGLIDKTSYYVRYSSSYYYANSDGDTVVIQYESPQMVLQPGNMDDQIVLTENYVNGIAEKRNIEEAGIPTKMLDHGKNWLHCVSVKSGLPAWLVAGTLFLSSFFLIWLCCATTSTAPKYHAKVLTLDDLLLLEEEENKATKKIPLSIVDAPEAGPLPVKVLIDDSQI